MGFKKDNIISTEIYMKYKEQLNFDDYNMLIDNIKLVKDILFFENEFVRTPITNEVENIVKEMYDDDGNVVKEEPIRNIVSNWDTYNNSEVFIEYKDLPDVLKSDNIWGGNDFEPVIKEDEYSKLYREFIESGKFKELLQVDISVIEKVSREKAINIFRNCILEYDSKIREEIINDYLNKLINKKVNDGLIDKVVFKPFTKKDILDMSMGEITHPVKDNVNISESDTLYNTVFSKIYWENTYRYINYDKADIARIKNFAHIYLQFPVVHPDKYLKTKNYLKTLMGLDDGVGITELLNYESFLVVPLKNPRWFSMSDEIEKEYLNFIDDKDVCREISFYTYTTDNLGKVTRNKISYHAVSYKLFENNKDISSRYRNLHNQSFWRLNTVMISGAYALVFLMAHIDLKETVVNGNKFIQTEELTLSSQEIISDTLSTMRNISKDGGSMLDIVTNVVPVIPAKFRDVTECIVNKKVQRKEDVFNSMYNSILQENNALRDLISGKPIIPYEYFYQLVYMFNKKLQATRMGVRNEQIYSEIDSIKQYIIEVCEELTFTDISIRRKQRNIQLILHRYICSVKEEGSKFDSQFTKLGRKTGIVRDEGLSKRIDKSARSAIIPDPNLELDTIGVPFDILKVWFEKEIVDYIKSKENWNSLKDRGEKQHNWIKNLTKAEESPFAVEGVNKGVSVFYTEMKYKGNSQLEKDREERARVEKLVIGKINDILKDVSTLAIRYPSLWKFNEMSFNIVMVYDQAIHLHPLVCEYYNADFDGDTMALFLNELESAVKEAREKMLPSKNPINGNDKPLLVPKQDAVVGLYYMSLNKNINDRNPNKDADDLISEYVEKYKKRKKIEILSDDDLQKVINDALEDDDIKNTARVTKHYDSYDVMYNDFMLGNVKLTDKVSVMLPHYKNSVFTSRLKHDNILSDVKTFKKSDGYITYQCKLQDICNVGNVDEDGYITIGDTFNFDNDEVKVKYNVPIEGNKTKVNVPCEELNSLDEFYNDLDIKLNMEDLIHVNSVKNDDIYEVKGKVVSTVGIFILNAYIPQNIGYKVRDKYKPETLFCLEIDESYFKSIGVEALNNECLKTLVKNIINKYDSDILKYTLDNLMKLGYRFATISGSSLSIYDMKPTPQKKAIIHKYQKIVDGINNNKMLLEEERKNKIVKTWTDCTDEVTQLSIDGMDIDNPLRQMCFSGARGSRTQIAQIVGMRGIMLDPDNEPILDPVLGNFIDGLNHLDYVTSSYGGRKGMIDRSNKTRDTGALTRSLIFGTSTEVINMGDCGDTEGDLLDTICYLNHNSGKLSGIGYYTDTSNISICSIYIQEAYTRENTLIIKENIAMDFKGILYSNKTPIYNIIHGRVLNSDVYNKLVENNFIKVKNEVVNEQDCKVYTTAVYLSNYGVTSEAYSETDYKFIYRIVFYRRHNLKDGYVSHGREFSVNKDGFNDEDINYYSFTISDDVDKNVIFKDYKKFTDENGYAYTTDMSTKKIIAYSCGFIPDDTHSSMKLNNHFSYIKNDYTREHYNIKFAYRRTIKLEYDYKLLDEGIGRSIIYNSLNDEVYYLLYTNNMQREYVAYGDIADDMYSYMFYPYNVALAKVDNNSYIPYKDFEYYYNYDQISGYKYNKNSSNIDLGDYSIKFKKSQQSVMHNEVVVALNEYSDIAYDLKGRYLAMDLYDRYTGKLICSKDTPLSIKVDVGQDVINKIQKQYDNVFIRSVVTCKAPGLCTKCIGYNFVNNSFAKVGDFIGATVSHTFGEFLSQTTMRTFHTGGAAIGGNIADTFESARSILVTSDLNNNYISSLLSSFKLLTDKEKTIARNKAKEIKKYYTFDRTSGRPVITGIKQEINDKIIDYSYFGVLRYGSFLEISHYIMNTLKTIFLTGGNRMLSYNYEVCAQVMMQYLTIVDSGDSHYIVGENITLNELIKDNLDLIFTDRLPILVVPDVTDISKCAEKTEQPMLAMQYKNITRQLGSLSINKAEDNMMNPITAVLTGNDAMCGDEFVKNISKSNTVHVVNDIQSFMGEEVVDTVSDKMLELSVAYTESKAFYDDVPQPVYEPVEIEESDDLETLLGTDSFDEEIEAPKFEDNQNEQEDIDINIEDSIGIDSISFNDYDIMSEDSIDTDDLFDGQQSIDDDNLYIDTDTEETNIEDGNGDSTIIDTIDSISF